MSYNLSTNQADRITYDQDVINYARTQAQECIVAFDPKEKPRIDNEFVGASWEAWKESIVTITDDLDEAEARFRLHFLDEVKREVLAAFAGELEDIEEAVVVYDTGCGSFGEFSSGKEAAAAVARSNINWWAMGEYPKYELLSEYKRQEQIAKDLSEYLKRKQAGTHTLALKSVNCTPHLDE